MKFLSRPWGQRSKRERIGLLVLAAVVALVINTITYALSGGDGDVLFAVNNVLVTPTWIMKEGMFLLKNNLKFTLKVNREYDNQYKVDGAKIGYVVNARLPVKVLVTEGDAFQGQDVEEKIVPIRITDLLNVALEFTAGSLTMEVDRYRERYLEPSFLALANEIDARGLKRMAQATAAFVGTPGVPAGSSGTLPEAAIGPYLDAGVKLDQEAVPTENRIGMLSPKMRRYLVSGTASMFNPAAAISANYRKGQFGNDQLGVEEWFSTQKVYRHTIGALGGTPVINGANQSGSTLILDGWTAVAATRLKKGDKFQIADVLSTDPLPPFQPTSDKRCFTLTADAASDAAGNMTVSFSPAIIGPGSPYQNVDSLPADNAAITIFGHASSYANVKTDQGLIFNKYAYACVSADLVKMEGAWMCERVRSKAIGLAFRVWKDRDIRTNTQPCRVDALVGWSAVRQELGVVACG